MVTVTIITTISLRCGCWKKKRSYPWKQPATLLVRCRERGEEEEEEEEEEEKEEEEDQEEDYLSDTEDNGRLTTLLTDVHMNSR